MATGDKFQSEDAGWDFEAVLRREGRESRKEVSAADEAVPGLDVVGVGWGCRQSVCDAGAGDTELPLSSDSRASGGAHELLLILSRSLPFWNSGSR